MDNFLKNLKKKEWKAMIEVMAFMSYNPSIGRALKTNSVKTFQKMAVSKADILEEIYGMKKFDRFHKRWATEFMKKIKTNKNKKCSYGHAQKAINVFLKLFVDWAYLPNKTTAKRLTPFLHVPLDRILMVTIKRNYVDFYKKEIRPLKEYGGDFSLSEIHEEEYYRWQEFFRKQYPKKPLLFDIAWALNR